MAKSAIAGVVLVSAICSLALADRDKSQFNLFNPTPRDQMRELNTDRPDVTESPYTVDAGHFQLELSFVEYTYDDDGGNQINEFSLAPSNFKLGLLNNVDL